MAITSRRLTWNDVQQNLSMQPKNRGDALIDPDDVLEVWKKLFRSPFFGGVVVEAVPPIQGHRVVGFGCGAILSSEFVDAQIANPQPDINSRILAGVQAGQSVLITRDELARANAGLGIDVFTFYPSCLRNEILNGQEEQDTLALMASEFVEWCAGYRIRRVICETAYEHSRRAIETSVVFQTVADFPEAGRRLHLMNRDSVNAMSSGLGNILFKFCEPLLRLRDSDRQLLSAALRGATDDELAAELDISFAAVKARWRSTFSRIAEYMPGLAGDDKNQDEGRGKQKRHRVLAYVRSHPEELRPYDWKMRA